MGEHLRLGAPGQPAEAIPIPPDDVAPDAGLRRDIRFLGRLLGESLVRQEGPDLLELVERVRTLTKAARRSPSPTVSAELDRLLGDLPLPTAIQLVRAFSAYFHL
ncbi:MAG: hypothetical protein KY447_00265, partial [Actinobacteria bacterium]|nr:hypothetical protein [Actinomycetota bacterium]